LQQLLFSIGEHEIEIEKQRQYLAEIEGFEAYASFT